MWMRKIEEAEDVTQQVGGRRVSKDQEPCITSSVVALCSDVFPLSITESN